MTKEQAFAEINKTQDEYIDELIGLINSPEYEVMKAINFTSPTGTGKTKMMSKLINRFPDYYFIITTLSKGQLHLQVKDSLLKDCNQDNFYVYGSADYKINSKLQAQDIINQIPKDTKCIWLRDEGHIATNRYDELLLDVCYKVINFSATNTHSDIQCNFTHTMMLRTVNQQNGTPEIAIKKLLEVKKIHKNIPNYNPCAIFRCVGGNTNIYNAIVRLCKQYKLKYIDITDDPFVMAELCKDDNEYDVIINKFKIVEGIDIRRSHIIYMDNQPKNNATTIQAIGRCRRNALLYRDDIDILAPKNKKLLEETRECFVYYNVEDMEIQTDIDGELQYAFCNYVSCEALKPNTTIEVINGQLPNGLYIIELLNQTGKFDVIKDKDTGFNVISPLSDFYDKKYIDDISNSYLYFKKSQNLITYYYKVKFSNIEKFPKDSFGTDNELYYFIEENCEIGRSGSVEAIVSADILNDYKNKAKKYSKDYIFKQCTDNNYCFLSDDFIDTFNDNDSMKDEIDEFLKRNKNTSLSLYLDNLKEHYIEYSKKHKLYLQIDEIDHLFNEDYLITSLKYYCIKEKEKDLNPETVIIHQANCFLDFVYTNFHFLFEYDIVTENNIPNINKLVQIMSKDFAYFCFISNKHFELFPLGIHSGIEVEGLYQDELVVKDYHITKFFNDLDCWLNNEYHNKKYCKEQNYDYEIFYSFEELYGRINYLLNKVQKLLENGYVS